MIPAHPNNPSGPPEQPGRFSGVLWAIFGTAAAVMVVVGLPILVLFLVVTGALTPDEPPSCDEEPHVLAWHDDQDRWIRSEPFVLSERSRIQVDVHLSTDGGILQGGNNVWAAPTGTRTPGPAPTTTSSTPTAGSSTAEVSTTTPSSLVNVGYGVSAVNEQVRLDAGSWELLTRGDAGPATVRWPC